MMDIFKQRRNLVAAIVVLVLLNIVTLLLLWFGRPKYDSQKGPGIPGREKGQVQKLLKEELNFSEKQAEQYIALRKEHRENTIQLNKEIRKIKREMFDHVLMNDETALSDSLLKLTLEKQAQIEKLTFQHFQELKKICNSDQLKKLMKIMHKILGPPQPERMGGPPPHPPGENREGFRPPPRGERSPTRD